LVLVAKQVMLAEIRGLTSQEVVLHPLQHKVYWLRAVLLVLNPGVLSQEAPGVRRRPVLVLSGIAAARVVAEITQLHQVLVAVDLLQKKTVTVLLVALDGLTTAMVVVAELVVRVKAA
jgi:hypothetical protein